MAEFINFEKSVEEDNNEEEEEENEVSDDSDLDSLSSFIDNEETENDVNFYGNFDNVETDIEQTLKAEYHRGLEDVENFDKISNLCEKVKCFGDTLLPKTKPDEEIEHYDFIRIILYALRYDQENKTDICDKNDFRKVIDEILIDHLD